MRILVVDDEQDICEILQYNLEMEGYEVATANSAEEALQLMMNSEFRINSEAEMNGNDNGNDNGNKSLSAKGDAFIAIAEKELKNRLPLPDLILLDVMMEGMSGFQMARKLKDSQETANIPIIFITALDSEDDIVKGLNIGADDYIAKPLSMKEVKARVGAVLRRTAGEKVSFSEDQNGARSNLGMASNMEPADVISYGGIILNLSSKAATLDDEDLSLTKLEFELLTLFLYHPNRVYSREDLLAKCWPDDVCVLERTVDVNITRLRKKIGRYGKQLKTRVGYGYYFEK